MTNIPFLEADGYIKGKASAELEQVMHELDHSNPEALDIELLKARLAEIHSLLVAELPKYSTKKGLEGE